MVFLELLIEYGEFRIYVYENEFDGKEYVVLVMGDVIMVELVLVWVHLECLIGDVFVFVWC